MRILITAFILLFAAVQMFKNDKTRKLQILLVTAICLTPLSLGYSFTLASFMLPFCYFVSEFRRLSDSWSKMEARYKLLFGVSFIAAIVLQVNSPHFQGFMPFIQLMVFVLFSEILIFFLSYGTNFQEVDFTRLYKTLYVAIIVLTVFAILNIIFGESVWIQIFNPAMYGNVLKDRMRIQAMFSIPFDYGYICAVLFPFIYYGMKTSYISKKKAWLLILCCLFGEYVSGSRTVIVAGVLSMGVLLLVTEKLTSSIRLAIGVFMLASMLYVENDIFREKTDFLIGTFDKENTQEGGSNLQMREVQYLTVLSYIKDKEMYGNGYKFFYYDMGWSGGRDTNVDDNLQGLEGVHLTYLLERGFFGYGCYLLVYLILCYSSVLAIKRDRLTGAASLSTLVCYLVFAHLTGELSSVYPTLLLSGFFLSINKSKANTIYNE